MLDLDTVIIPCLAQTFKRCCSVTQNVLPHRLIWRTYYTQKKHCLTVPAVFAKRSEIFQYISTEKRKYSYYHLLEQKLFQFLQKKSLLLTALFFLVIIRGCLLVLLTQCCLLGLKPFDLYKGNPLNKVSQKDGNHEWWHNMNIRVAKTGKSNQRGR